MDTVTRSRRFAVVPLVAGVALGACTTSDMQAYTPVEQKTKHSEETLRVAARRALEAKGYPTLTTESEPSVIQTREKEVFVSSVPRLAYRYTFRVGVKGGTLVIASTCKKNTALEREDFEDCGDERPARVIAEQKAIHEDILERAEKAR